MLFAAAALGSLIGLFVAYWIDQLHQRQVMRELGLATPPGDG